jgi:O-acetyl-ADP-ribose deacetylase (regulator of RNase III)
MLDFVEGDFFDFDADIRVNTVNCVGVMGAGVALAFKNRYPDMFHHYVEQCKEKKVKPGKPFVWLNRDIISKEVEIINFPTKDDWRNPSEYSYVENGLIWLSEYLQDRKGKTVTLPALGCGHGGLEWDKVKTLIEKHLKNTQANVLVFEPSSSKAHSKNNNDILINYSVLNVAGINVIDASDTIYPSSLRRYTNKILYAYSSSFNFSNYDISLICSSKPAEQERLLIDRILNICGIYGMSVLMGGAAYEKKLAFEHAQKGVKVACFLPAGIYESAIKLKDVKSEKPILLSIGNPYASFDKKEYMPAVLSRIYLAKNNIFTTNRLSWLSKYEKKIKKDGIQSYFYFHSGLKDEDIEAALKSGSKKLTSDLTSNEIELTKLISNLKTL